MVIPSAVVVGLAVLAAGVVPWMLLAAGNQRVWVGVPWAMLPMALYLWGYWKYLAGAGWPRSTAALRRTSLRANRLSGDVFGMSLFAGLVGLFALVLLPGVMARLVTLPAESQPITLPAGMPFVTAFLLLVMASIVAGVVEEAAFRGYMQGPIERRYGPIVAILVSGAVFGFGHYTHHPASVVVMLPFYIAVSAVYGGLAYLTNSILPSLVLHAGGDVWSLTRLWLTGRPEWQGGGEAPRLIWESGVDATFLGSAGALVVVGTGAVLAYRELARAVRQAS